MALVGWWFESLLVHSGVSFFFPSSMADVALWLGPYRSISSQKRLQGPRRSISAGKSQQIKKQKTKQTNKTTRKSPNQICVSSKQKTDQTHKRGRSPNKNTHQQDLPEDTRESQVRPAERQRAPTKKKQLEQTRLSTLYLISLKHRAISAGPWCQDMSPPSKQCI